jgi:selenocysteine-specific elongation factor
MARSIHPIVVGTAGHIDHGKSSLVRALTGIDPDRLKEEKERGLTIDLGFARMKLGDGSWLGFVDVPGHERFVRNMVAGCTGLDLVLLVVAADDGVMPQTIEHVDILHLLQVRAGLIVLNKVDMVDPTLADIAAEEVRALVAGTVLADAPIVRTSVVTGEGLDELRQRLEALALATASRRSAPWRPATRSRSCRSASASRCAASTPTAARSNGPTPATARRWRCPTRRPPASRAAWWWWRPAPGRSATRSTSNSS